MVSASSHMAAQMDSLCSQKFGNSFSVTSPMERADHVGGKSGNPGPDRDDRDGTSMLKLSRQGGHGCLDPENGMSRRRQDMSFQMCDSQSDGVTE